MRLFVYFLFGLVLVLPASLFASTFYRTLSFGMTGEDVRYLQSLLNKDSRTQVVATGPGSPGQESLFFGQKTRDAVMRFQELYKYEILIPLNIASPTGTVGSQTQQKLVAVSSEKSLLTAKVSQNIPNANSLGLVNEGADGIEDLFFNLFNLPIKVLSASPLSVAPGGVLKIYGQGFLLNGNRISFGSFVVDNIPSKDSAYLEVVIPKNITPGVYDLKVSHKGGESTLSSKGAYITVSNDPVPLPYISFLDTKPVVLTHITPSSELHLKVFNIEEGAIEIITTIGSIKSVVNEEKMVTFSLSDASGWKDMKFPDDVMTSRFLPVYIYVKNEAGYSDPVTVFVHFKK